MVARQLVSIAICALAASSCFFPVHEQGTVTFVWSVGGTAVPQACADHSASTVHIALRDDFNHIVAATDAPCEAFRSRFILYSGSYDASLTLLDARGAAVSETRYTYVFYVAPHVDTLVRVAFEGAPPQ